MTATVQSQGKVTQVLGPVVDVEFPPGDLPQIFTALRVSNPSLGRRRETSSSRWRSTSARTPSAPSPWTPPMGSPAACRCGTPGSPIVMPVGKATLGRILNVVGEPVDEKGR
jgi:F-type H+-transporting ATPase subunit beta